MCLVLMGMQQELEQRRSFLLRHVVPSAVYVVWVRDSIQSSDMPVEPKVVGTLVVVVDFVDAENRIKCLRGDYIGLPYLPVPIGLGFHKAEAVAGSCYVVVVIVVGCAAPSEEGVVCSIGKPVI